MTEINRRKFLTNALSAGLLGLVLPLGKAAGHDLATMVFGHCAETGANGEVSSNHGHIVVIPKEDIMAAEPKTYSIQGNGTHDHTITLTSEEFVKLGLEKTLEKFSTQTNNHTHRVTLVC